MKTKELIYIIQDLCKNVSDDAFFTEEDVEWLLKKNRSFLLKREQERTKQLSQSNMQTICVNLQKENAFCGTQCNEVYLKSIDAIPQSIGGIPTILTVNMFQTNISFVPFEKFRYVNCNKYLRNIIFATIGNDMHVYIKGSNPAFENLDKIVMQAIFDDFEEAAALSCNASGETVTCDPFEMEFPIEPYLVPELVDRVLREMLGATYRPKDNSNDAQDNLSQIANFIRQYMKKPLTNMIDGQESE